MVWLEEKPSFRKERLLAPVVPRYRGAGALAGLNDSLLSIVRNVAATPDGSLVLVKNSKAGCTSLAAILYRVVYGKAPEGWVHDNEGLISWRNRPGLLVPALRRPEAFRFSFVRDPLSRTVSAFQDLVLDATNNGASVHAPYLEKMGLGRARSGAEKFDVFLAYLEASFAEDPIWTDRHFRLQWRNLGWGEVEYAFIGRLERWGEDLRALLEQAGVWRDELEPVLSTRINTAKREPFRPSPEQAVEVERLYARDFELFDYPPVRERRQYRS